MYAYVQVCMATEANETKHTSQAVSLLFRAEDRGRTEWQKCKGQYTRPHRSRRLYSGTYKVNTQSSYAYTHEEIYRSKPTETLLKHTLTPTVYLVASQFKWKSLIQNMTLLVYVSEIWNALLQVWFNPEFPEGTRLSNLDFLLFSRYYYLRVTSY